MPSSVPCREDASTHCQAYDRRRNSARSSQRPQDRSRCAPQVRSQLFSAQAKGRRSPSRFPGPAGPHLPAAVQACLFEVCDCWLMSCLENGLELPAQFVRVKGLTFPDGGYAPAQLFEFPLYTLVARNVILELSFPEFNI